MKVTSSRNLRTRAFSYEVGGAENAFLDLSVVTTIGCSALQLAVTEARLHFDLGTRACGYGMVRARSTS